MSSLSATSTKISGSSTSEGWKKAKQRRSAGIEPAAQVVPALDLVHRLVGDDLVEDGRRRLPVDAAQHQEAAVEPGRQQMHQIAIDRRQAPARGAPIRSRRMATISAVAPGARLRRRKNSRRGLSTARCSAATVAALGARKIGLGGAFDRARRPAAWCAQGTSRMPGGPRRRARGSAPGSRWRWRRRRPRRGRRPAPGPARRCPRCGRATPSERGSSWRPCSAIVFKQLLEEGNVHGVGLSHAGRP